MTLLGQSVHLVWRQEPGFSWNSKGFCRGKFFDWYVWSFDSFILKLLIDKHHLYRAAFILLNASLRPWLPGAFKVTSLAYRCCYLKTYACIFIFLRSVGFGSVIRVVSLARHWREAHCHAATGPVVPELWWSSHQPSTAWTTWSVGTVPELVHLYLSAGCGGNYRLLQLSMVGELPVCKPGTGICMPSFNNCRSWNKLFLCAYGRLLT